MSQPESVVETGQDDSVPLCALLATLQSAAYLLSKGLNDIHLQNRSGIVAGSGGELHEEIDLLHLDNTESYTENKVSQ